MRPPSGMTMTNIKSLGETQLASLLCSKICHDIINPVGAIVNGLEVLSDDDNGDMRDIAMDILWKSAVRTSSLLKFTRLAFGAAGSAGSALDLGEIKDVASGYVITDKITMEWTSPMGQLAKDDAKFLLNLIMIAPSAIVFGGNIAIVIGENLETPEFTITATGRKARIPENIEALCAGEIEPEDIDARKIQPYFCGMIGRSVGAEIKFSAINEDTVVFSAAFAR